MTSLIGIHSLSKSYGTQQLFREISLTIAEGERIGLLGPNGSGKSTLLEIIMGLESPDSGFITQRQNIVLGYAGQDPEFPPKPLDEILTDQPGLSGCQFDLVTRAGVLLSKAQFSDFKQLGSHLSGGWKKRLDIVKALMLQPDLLLFDEPTNHLDIEGIVWLEKLLAKEKTAFLVVSHDRYFLENVATKIIELNRCYPQGLFVCEGAMSSFIEHKQQFLDGQQQQERGLAGVVRNEISWLKKSPQARTTKSRSRIAKAYELMDELAALQTRNKQSKVDLNFSASERATRKLLTVKNLSKSLGGKLLFEGIDMTLSPGSRIAIVGGNGTGKTTLLKVLAGMSPQDKGTIKYADDLQLVYFDQHREQIPNHFTLRQALSPMGEYVNYRGQEIHVNGWAKKFLFTPDRLSLPVSSLSGGERARILIAKLMLQPADILFLDEPTNDLDIETLEIIEESLQNFAGAVVLISHDRCLMDRVCTQFLGLGVEPKPSFFADYNQWETHVATLTATVKKESVALPSSALPEDSAPASKTKKLSYKEQKELEGMETNILATEMEIEALQAQLDDPAISSDSQKAMESYTLLAQAQKKLDQLFERWEFLSQK